MYEFVNLLAKIRASFQRYLRILFLIDLAASLSIFYMILFILNIDFLIEKLWRPPLPPSLILSLILAFLTSGMMHRKDSRINVIPIIEKKYSELSEKLRTAYDNKEEENIIIEDLAEKVSGSLAKVPPSSLIAKKITILKIIIAALMISATTLVSFTHTQISPETLQNFTQPIFGKEGGLGNETVVLEGRPEALEDKVGAGKGGKILGKPTIASIEGKNIDLLLYQGVGTGFEVRESSETRKGEFVQSPLYPVDIVASNVSDGGYQALLGRSAIEKDLINRYAFEISKT